MTCGEVDVPVTMAPTNTLAGALGSLAVHVAEVAIGRRLCSSECAGSQWLRGNASCLRPFICGLVPESFVASVASGVGDQGIRGKQ